MHIQEYLTIQLYLALVHLSYRLTDSLFPPFPAGATIAASFNLTAPATFAASSCAFRTKSPPSMSSPFSANSRSILAAFDLSASSWACLSGVMRHSRGNFGFVLNV